jgi:hypothetical protein
VSHVHRLLLLQYWKEYVVPGRSSAVLSWRCGLVSIKNAMLNLLLHPKSRIVALHTNLTVQGKALGWVRRFFFWSFEPCNTKLRKQNLEN